MKNIPFPWSHQSLPQSGVGCSGGHTPLLGKRRLWLDCSSLRRFGLRIVQLPLSESLGPQYLQRIISKARTISDVLICIPCFKWSLWSSYNFTVLFAFKSCASCCTVHATYFGTIFRTVALDLDKLFSKKPLLKILLKHFWKMITDFFFWLQLALIVFQNGLIVCHLSQFLTIFLE